MIKNLLLILFIILFYPNSALACFSITDDYNSPNPVLNASFNLQPDVSPFTDCWTGAIRIRSNKNHWRLVANRTGPHARSIHGNSEDNIKPSDIKLDFELRNFGMADNHGAILVSPFSSQTDLSEIQNGTLIISGIKKSGNSCSSHNPNFYKLKKSLCLFRDFVFNTGQYNGEISYLLIAP